jgi:peptidoglycan/LPS O-acetylase OafA/YrhL
LRGTAALLVVFAHFDTPFLLGGGAAGVLAFFVLSGFLITALLLEEQRAAGRIAIGMFYGRRARRLLPALLLVLVVTFLAASWMNRLSEVMPHIAATAFYVSNLLPVVAPLGHTWTLAAEEQFYLVWPAVLVGISLLDFPAARTAVVITALCSVTLLPLPSWVAAAFGCVALGSLLAIAAVGNRLPQLRTSAFGWLGLVALGAASTVRYGAEENVLVRSLAAAGIVSLLFAVAVDKAPSILGLRPLRYVGRVSYGFYLWHVPVRWMFETNGVKVRIYPDDFLWNLPMALTIMAFAFLLAVGSYHFLERLFLRHGPPGQTNYQGVRPSR